MAASDVAPMPVATGSAMAFLRWLESAGNAQELRVEAGQHLFNQPTTPEPRGNLLRRAAAATGLWVFADELHGNQAVAQDLRQRSIAASVLLSGSSLIDYISSLGLFAFIFRLAPAGPIPYSLGLSTLLLLFGNWSGRAMVDRHKGQAILTSPYRSSSPSRSSSRSPPASVCSSSTARRGWWRPELRP
jgi:hypothetical protein